MEKAPDIWLCSACPEQAEASDLYRGADGSVTLLDGAPRAADETPVRAQDARKLYAKYGLQLCEHLRGLYTLVICLANGTTVLFQDEFGGALPLYFAPTQSGYCVSTSLGKLLRSTGLPRALDTHSAELFLHYGVVPGARTLVQGVRKLPQMRIAVLRTPFSLSWRLNRYAKTGPDEMPGEAEYFSTFGESLRASCEDITGPLCTALSGGYDSNLILHTLREQTDAPIEALSVGGRSGVDETGVAAQLAALRGNVRFRSRLVGPQTLEHLPDMVFRLQGAVYERGIFLQYELAELARQANASYVILGEGADQVMDVQYGQPLAFLMRALRGIRLPPREMLGLVVLKKNALMLRGVGITPRYPYLHERFVPTARALARQNGTSKAFHKRAVSGALPPEAAVLLQKVGGSTQLKPLFADDLSYERVCAAVRRLPLNRPGRRIRDRYGAEEALRNYCLAMLYLHLFERIFLSGEYDSRFDLPRLDEPLSAFLDALPSDAPSYPLPTPRGRNPVQRLAVRCVKKALHRK